MDWIISREEAIGRLRNTKLDFLVYEDLISSNALFDAMLGLRFKKIERKAIEGWNANKDLTLLDFADFFFPSVGERESILLISDEGHVKKWVFALSINEMTSFANWYEDYFNREFFEYGDYLVVFPCLNMIRHIDDEGGMNEYIVY
ncbi:hypothetical protein [Chitinophaga flava]|uniref:Uncharacterized protein n=1 Tax=Chitinophaga flava TaxID=2259036 RepID=A0A365Y0M9_9BACT|nr:hypothetical protein [Chitinophaga flava]RBL91484.1 hypothetical protein DF182_02405 [Chitinophaga flava]